MNCNDEEYMKMKNLHYRDTIGCGASGVVYKVYDPIYNREFALKSINLSKFNQTEVECMKQVDDPNVVPLYNYEFYNGYVYLLMEFCPITLEKFCMHNNSIGDQKLIKYALDILKSIRACHRNRVAHLDIKPSNFVIDQYDRVRVCDFGLSLKINIAQLDETYCGSIPFIAPEILAKVPHDPLKADVWAIGVTFFIMATGKFPWAGDDRQTLCQNLMTMPPRIEMIHNKDFAQIIKECLTIDPEKRPSVESLISRHIFNLKPLSVIKKHPFGRIFELHTSRDTPFSKSNLIVRPKIQRAQIQQSAR